MGVVRIKTFPTAQNLRQILPESSSPKDHIVSQSSRPAVRNGPIMRNIWLRTGFICERTQRGRAKFGDEGSSLAVLFNLFTYLKQASRSIKSLIQIFAGNHEWVRWRNAYAQRSDTFTLRTGFIKWPWVQFFSTSGPHRSPLGQYIVQQFFRINRAWANLSAWLGPSRSLQGLKSMKRNQKWMKKSRKKTNGIVGDSGFSLNLKGMCQNKRRKLRD